MTTTTTIDHLEPHPENLRRFDPDDPAQRELEDSIAGALGILEPLIVSPNAQEGHYVIIAGERRWRAVQTLVRDKRVPKTFEIPITVRDLTPEQITEAMLIENLRREGLNPVEEALGYLRLVGFGLKQTEIAKRIGSNPKLVASRLRLASLPEVALEAVRSGEVTLEHADHLVTLVEISGAEALDAEEVITSEYHARLAIAEAKRTAQTDAIAKHIPDTVIVGDLEHDERDAMKDLGRVQPEDVKKAVEVPKGATHATITFDWQHKPTVSFYRPMTDAEQKKAGLVDGKKPKTSDAEKERRAAQRAETIRQREFASKVSAKPKVGEVNAFLPIIVRSLVHKADVAKELCPILGIEPKIDKVNVGGGKTQNQRDWVTPLLGFYDESDTNARRVAMAFFATDYRTKDVCFKTFGFRPKKVA